jgi:aspartyl-tRNA(Asn)/glutamyl-tRNA(Gln) amidotransferase subunit A
MLKPDVWFATIEELAPEIRAQRLSPVELTRGFLDRIERLNARFNAFEKPAPELALEQAQRAESELKGNKYRGPLHGVPYAAKDLFDTKGIPTAWGTSFLRDRVPSENATVVDRLEQAGAVLLGKTAMVEFAGCLGYRFASASASGPGRNPWDPSRWTGGSSSGSGAAVAAGLATFAIGTETWGSILCPSAFCGLTGIRPTYGLVSRAGGMVGAYTFDKVGPLTHSVGDCRIVLTAMAGADPRDPSCATERTRLERGRGRHVRQLKAALVPLDWSKVGEPEVRAAFEAGVAELRAAGLEMETAELPKLPASEVAGLLISVEALAAFEPFLNDGRVKQLVDDMAPRQRELAEPVTGADTVKAMRIRESVQRAMRDFLDRYDVIVTPNFMSVAPPVEQDLNVALPYGDPVGGLAAACGLPGLALPAGFGKANMPAGFQLVGSPFDEATLLELGELYQSRTNHHRQLPPVT